ncbi:glycosyltransferase family 2 protein [Collinsella intestinalis]|uniref:glycosyltransferase family 2 protein n=1 Tax=Collinsella intestinalis TaxID=147207 RepID=UPI00195926D5|nr:glycosyltransferase family 2 protein [Collinsella intestinalis]MBM6683710.1 glycosyltransferase family 2 protein [Collinsella intestinalis]
MNQELVSVVVAIYKSERFLDKLITSIVKQTYSNLDVILVDDGSPDGSGVICDKYAAVDERIRVIHKSNGGACDARNTGIAAAKGDYLVIVDGDDWLAPDCIEYLLKLMHMPGVKMAMTDSVFTTRDLKQNDTDEVVVMSAEEAVTYIIYPWIPIGPWNKMYSMDVLRNNEITFSTKWSGEGLYYSAMAAQASEKVAMGHRRIYYYRMNNDNSGLTDYKVEMGLNALENIQIIRERLTIRTPKTLNACDWHIWKNHGYTLFLIIATGQRKKYAKQYRECINYLRCKLPDVLFKSELKLKTKLRMLFQGVAPVLYSNLWLMRETQQRKADTYVEGE